jgi:SAM-dependent methyltransferase
MVKSIQVRCLATDENFDEESYLAANPDVAAAVAAGRLPSGISHFSAYGKGELRSLLQVSDINRLRKTKIEKLKPLLRTDMQVEWRGDKADYLTDQLRRETRIVPTDAVSANEYDGHGLNLINGCAAGLVLDCGAGFRNTYYENVVNYEIADYPSTDILGVGEKLPFQDNSFEGVISVAVLEHVRNPFKCAEEISRVLKPGGRLYCAVPFLQPYHGYPHHYFNATAQGIRRLFEDQLDVERVDVIDSMHPIFALQWIVNSWAEGLSPETREKFQRLTVKDLLRSPLEVVSDPFCQELTNEKRLELACATVIFARKPD